MDLLQFIFVTDFRLFSEEMELRNEPLAPGSLAISGSTILPEQKPKVPTMSERDLTRQNKIYY